MSTVGVQGVATDDGMQKAGGAPWPVVVSQENLGQSRPETALNEKDWKEW
jgi:hypothetical protein